MKPITVLTRPRKTNEFALVDKRDPVREFERTTAI